LSLTTSGNGDFAISIVGTGVGGNVGVAVAVAVGIIVGISVGTGVGIAVGIRVGFNVGSTDLGITVAESSGFSVAELSDSVTI
jgi:hypothetical protein